MKSKDSFDSFRLLRKDLNHKLLLRTQQYHINLICKQGEVENYHQVETDSYLQNTKSANFIMFQGHFMQLKVKEEINPKN